MAKEAIVFEEVNLRLSIELNQKWPSLIPQSSRVRAGVNTFQLFHKRLATDSVLHLERYTCNM